MKLFHSSSSAQTKKFASALAHQIVKRKKQGARRGGATVLALVGELGSGKTTFVQGFMRGLGIKKRAVSPTFILFRRFALRTPRFANVYHVDAYRIKTARDLLHLGFKKILADPKNIVLIEWADRVKKILPRRVHAIRFVHGTREDKRLLRY